MKPIIGITAPDKFWNPAYLALKFAVWMSGGKPVALKNIDSVNQVKIDGLLLGGGTDIFPEIFKHKPKKDYSYDQERDKMEILWLKKAEKEDIPVLAICRGSQLMNVMNGGDLHMDISLVYENAIPAKNLIKKIFGRKKIFIKEGSLLHKIFKIDHLKVNSLHSQSIRHTGENLEITATESNGIVQAIENPNHRFYIGLQFHPEFLLHRKTLRSIFYAFVETAAAKMRERN